MAEVRLTPEQRAVVENRGGSLLVSAAAGSGKTKVLVERLFRYITEEHCNVDDFLIITFTKAAAAELRSKIAAELSKRLAEQPEDSHLRAQLLRVYQADIKTVDAFCAALLRENTHLLAREEDARSLSPDFRVLDEDEARLLREQTLNRTLERFYGDLGEGDELLADTLGFGRDDRALFRLVLELYDKLQSHAFPEHWMQEQEKQWELCRSGEESFDETPYAAVLLKSVRDQAAHWARLLLRSAEETEEDEALAKGYGQKFRTAAQGLLTLSESKEWESARETVLQVEFPKLTTPRGRKDEPDILRMKRLWDGSKDAVKKISKTLSVSSTEAMEDLTATAPAMIALLHLTAAFSEDYRQAKLRRNAADFSDQEHLALQILLDADGRPTELGRQIAGRYREILVDEFQDTNEVQNQIYRAVSREGMNLFTVGDVKQSIYRFRLADPGIFLAKYNSFPPYEKAKEGQERKILLSRNFRSRREVLDAANFVFRNILSPEMGEMEYGEAEALHFGAEYYPERQDCRTEYHLISCVQRTENGEKAVKRSVAEARFVARRIRSMLKEGFPVTEGDGSLRPCRPEDIVILMRSPGSRLTTYADALAEEGIPCAFDESGDYFTSMEVSTVLSLLKLIDNPRQDIPLIAVLRSPLLGFTPDRLAQIRGRRRKGDFYTALQEDGGEDAGRFLRELEEFRLLSRDLSVSRLLWHIYHKWNILGVFGTMDGGAQRRENLIALTEHAERLEGSGYCGIFSFLLQMQRLLEAGRAPRTHSAAAISGVRLMSIHKSKGLEFPIVFLADLDHAFSRQDLEPSVLVHPRLGLGPTRVELERRIKYPTLARQAVMETLERENKAEEQRILYVGMTRAKEKLILVQAVYHAEKRMKDLVPLAACPALPETVGERKNLGDWILLPLLCRPEAGVLRELSGMEQGGWDPEETLPWQVELHDSLEFSEASAERSGEETEREEQSFDPSLLEFVYPHAEAVSLPAKLTATQLKGRELDAEIAEEAQHVPYLRPLSQPKFRQAGGDLTAAEAGTATHLALQYLDFADPDAAGQVAVLQERHLLTPQQGAAIRISELERFLNSPLASELRSAETLLREYRFTLLVPARELDGGSEEDSVLLQGIVDCCFGGKEGPLTVVDFKTDRVTGEALLTRAEEYRPQLTAYSMALERVLERKVTRKVLYFFHAGQSVEL